MAPGLLNMPEDVMNKIMKDIGITTILTLRKVCHDLRNFIDDVKPDANLKEIWTKGEKSNSVSVRYYFAGGYHHVEYERHEEGCLVKNRIKGNEILLKNENYITVFKKDFQIVLEHQKSVLKEFIVFGTLQKNMDDIILKNLQRILESIVHPLKVETYHALVIDQNQLMLILPFLDSKTLSELIIFSKESPFKIDQLVKLDQWRNIKQAIVGCYVEYEYIQHFTHLSETDVSFKSNHFPDLVSLKTLFLQSSAFKTINIIPTNYYMNDAQRSVESLGEPYLDTDNIMKWYYRIPATNEVLEICVTSENLQSMRIKLSRMDEKRVQQNAVIHN